MKRHSSPGAALFLYIGRPVALFSALASAGAFLRLKGVLPEARVEWALGEASAVSSMIYSLIQKCFKASFQTDLVSSFLSIRNC